MEDMLLSDIQLELIFQQFSCTEDILCDPPPPPPIPDWLECHDVPTDISSSSLHSVFHNIIIICISSVIIVISLILMVAMLKR